MSDIESALVYLRQQSIERGLGGRLGDFSVVLSEDDQTISVWAFYSLDEPLMTHVELPEPIDPTTFDAGPYYRAASNFSTTNKDY